jgi:hypothetical protein
MSTLSTVLEIIGALAALATAVGPLLSRSSNPKTRKAGRMVEAIGLDFKKLTGKDGHP